MQERQGPEAGGSRARGGRRRGAGGRRQERQGRRAQAQEPGFVPKRSFWEKLYKKKNLAKSRFA